MGKIINVKELLDNKKKELKIRVDKLLKKGFVPKLAVILANNDEASRTYISKKRNLCQEMGIEQIEYIYDENVSEKTIEEKIKELNESKEIVGILLQVPVFKHLDEKKLLETISPKKDVDGFHPLNVGRLMQGIPGVISCTPKGILTILDSLNIDFEGKDAVIVGRSVIVGKPMASILINKGMTVTVCNSKTINLKKHTKMADLLIVATGKPKLITKDMVKKDVVVIDVGINKVNGIMCGDVDTKNVIKKASFITSVPGGVGLATVYSLIENLVELAEDAVEFIEEIK